MSGLPWAASMFAARMSLMIAAAALLGAAAGCGGGSGAGETTATAPAPVPRQTIRVELKNAQPVGGIERATVGEGDNVVLVVHSDVADEIHLHGYDRMQDVAAGGTARIAFVANIPGRFEAELEQRGVQIAEITVAP
jgi:hypothetical protein